MKKRIVSLSLAVLIGIGIGSISGCSNKNNQAQASESSSNGYLKYCGTQNKLFGDNVIQQGDRSSIAVYEDTVHKKVIYVGTDGWQHSVTVSVSDMK